MSFKYSLAITISCLLLSSCATTMYLVKNPKTGDIRECRGNPNEVFDQVGANKCVKEYEKLGYERVK